MWFIKAEKRLVERVLAIAHGVNKEFAELGWENGPELRIRVGAQTWLQGGKALVLPPLHAHQHVAGLCRHHRPELWAQDTVSTLQMNPECILPLLGAFSSWA